MTGEVNKLYTCNSEYEERFISRGRGAHPLAPSLRSALIISLHSDFVVESQGMDTVEIWGVLNRNGFSMPIIV